jgi:hypothetical protein
MKIHPPYPNYNYFRGNCSVDPDNVGLLCDLSILAYAATEVEVQCHLRGAGLKGTLLQEPDLQAIICTEQSTAVKTPVVVAFRGTLGIRDWELDLDSDKDEDGFHHGFSKATGRFLPTLYRLLYNRDVIFTGHSLGAAMAAVAAARLRSYCNVLHICNFGQPRIGNCSAVQKLLGLRWTRYVHGDDIVAAVPPEVLGFMHGGTEVRLPALKRPWYGAFSTEWPFIIGKRVWDHIPTAGYAQVWGE